MATQVSKRELDNLKAISDASSCIHLALEYIREDKAIDGSVVLAVRALLVEGNKRLLAHIDPPAAAARG